MRRPTQYSRAPASDHLFHRADPTCDRPRVDSDSDADVGSGACLLIDDACGAAPGTVSMVRHLRHAAMWPAN